MGHSYTYLTVHAVFSTKQRRELITPDIAARLYEYIGGILRAESCSLIGAGGMPDHTHLLFRMHPTKAIANLLRVVKSRSTGWVHQTFPGAPGFAWQTGYGGFTVSRSGVDEVARYIANQAEHHRHMTFQEEYIILLEKHGIEYDPRYIWD